MAKKTLLDDVLDLVKSACFHLPFWAVPILATIAGALTYWVANKVFGSFTALGGGDFTKIQFAMAVGAFVVTFAAGLSGSLERKQRKLLAEQTRSLQQLRDLSWREFELLTAEAYRQQGFTVAEGSGNAPDGGIDLIATAPDGGRHLIQCKHWKTGKIGVKVVRETLGVLTKEGGAQAVVIGTGEFTRDALKFTEGQPIQLINGAQLLELLNQNQGAATATATSAAPEPLPTPPADLFENDLKPEPEQSCPQCGSALTKRVAKRGANAGNAFWGCTEFPRCRYTKEI